MATLATRLMMALVLAAGGLAAAMLACPERLTGLKPTDRRAATTLVSGPDEQIRRLAQRLETKVATARQYVAGELTLLEAASCFGRLSSGPGDRSWLQLPGNSDGEKLCRQVLGWAELELEEMTASPEEARRKMQEMSEELDRAFGADGAIVLP